MDRDLDSILAGLDESLFIDSSSEDYSEVQQETDPIFDEWISNSVAESLLDPKDYEEKYRYKLITTQYGSIVEKINADKNESIEEFEIDSPEDVQSYEEMRQIILMGPRRETKTFTYARDLYETPKDRFWLKTIAYMGVLMLIAGALVAFVLNV